MQQMQSAPTGGWKVQNGTGMERGGNRGRKTDTNKKFKKISVRRGGGGGGRNARRIPIFLCPRQITYEIFRDQNVREFERCTRHKR